ncbi:MAG: hypothetical protein HYZ67_06700 [Chlamydiae bacterium]|nr:hypothetical protein [Chlamydiota bacterium]
MLRRFLIFLILLNFLPAWAEDRLVSINFENADLRLVIKFVSEMTGENFVVDEAVKGSVTVVAPSKISVDEVRPVLESVLKASGYVMVPSGPITKVVPLETAYQESTETVPQGGAVSFGENFVTQIFPLKSADAEKMSGIIHSFLTRGGYVTFYGPTNTLIVSDSASNMNRIQQILKNLDQGPSAALEEVYVYSLKNADVQNVAQVLTQLFEKEGASSGSAENKTPWVVADPMTNALLIHASREKYLAMKKAIRKLDAPKKQILVEVLVAEVNIDQTEKMGIEWATVEGVVYGSQEGFGGDRVHQSDDIAHNVLTGGKFEGTSAAYLHDTLSVGTLSIPRLGILINAFRNHSNINILSTPQLLTTDHSEAEILVGENRAFIKNAQVTPEGSTVRTFEFKDIGLSLKLRPHIAADGWVRMEVQQKVEDVIGQSFEGAVETSKREARTLITVKDSQTAVIGGLIRERKDKVIHKVPILGDIPLLGLPFTRIANETVKTNLLIFICPHILDSEQAISQMTEKKRAQAGMTLEKQKTEDRIQNSEGRIQNKN